MPRVVHDSPAGPSGPAGPAGVAATAVPLAAGEAGKEYTWDDLTAVQKEATIRLLPPDIAARVRAGERISAAEVQRLVQQHYNTTAMYGLYKVPVEASPVPGQPSVRAREAVFMRAVLCDAVPRIREDMAMRIRSQDVANWPLDKLLSMGIPCPAGHVWLVVDHPNGIPKPKREGEP